MNRRRFIVGSAVAAAGAALASSLGLSGARAAAPKGTKQAPGYYRTKVGSIELIALLDGGMTLGDELMLKADAATLAAAREKNFITAGKVFPAYVNGYVVNTGAPSLSATRISFITCLTPSTCQTRRTASTRSSGFCTTPVRSTRP